MLKELLKHCRNLIFPKCINKNFYVNCCLKEEIDTPDVRIYDPHLNIKPPFDVIKLSYKKNICYVRVRTADQVYLKKFLPHIRFEGEHRLFSDAISNYYDAKPIIFISEYYRRVLGIEEMTYEVEDAQGLNSNIRELELRVPTNWLCYLMYLFNSSLIHPQLEIRFKGIISILMLLFTLLNLCKTMDIIIFFISAILFLGMFLSWRKINILSKVLLISGLIILCINKLIISLFPSLSDESLLNWFTGIIVTIQSAFMCLINKIAALC